MRGQWGDPSPWDEIAAGGSAPVFAAKYTGGYCASCGETIEEGEEITWGDGDLVHSDCTGRAPEKPVEVCRACQLVKPCFCEGKS